MKNKTRKAKRRRAAWAAFILTACLCTGCGDEGYARSAPNTLTADSSYNSGITSDSGGSFYEEESGVLDSGFNGGKADNVEVADGRRLIKTVDLEVETRDYETLMTSLETQIQEMGGYIENMEAYNGSSYSASRGSRYANISARIPAGRLNDFLGVMSDIGNVVRRYDNVEEVTMSYVDMEGRRDTLRTEQSRLLAFLEKAETIEDILTIEERLSTVRYQLESMESQLRTMDNLISFSTVKMKITEVKELSPVVVEEKNAWQRAAEGFLESLHKVGDGIIEFVIWLVAHIPYFVAWAAVITAIIFIFRKIRERKRRKKEARIAQMNLPAQKKEAE